MLLKPMQSWPTIYCVKCQDQRLHKQLTLNGKNRSESYPIVAITHCGNQSYSKVTIKVTNIKDINIQILCFFIHAFTLLCPMFFIPKKMMPKKWQLIFIYDNYINFIHTWGNFDRLIKVTQVWLTLLRKCDQSYLTHFAFGRG